MSEFQTFIELFSWQEIKRIKTEMQHQQPNNFELQHWAGGAANYEIQCWIYAVKTTSFINNRIQSIHCLFYKNVLVLGPGCLFLDV